MKKLIPLSLICLLFLGVSSTQAQTAEQPVGFKIFFGTQSYNGDLGNEIAEFGDSDFLYGIGLSWWLNDAFDLSLEVQNFDLDKANGPNDPVFAKRNTSFSTDVLNANLMLRFKPGIGGSRLHPYLAAGIGGNYLQTDSDVGVQHNDETSYIFSIPFGIGINYEVRDDMSLNVQGIYNRTFEDQQIDGYPLDASDAVDGNSRPDIDGIDHDDFFTLSIGVVYNFGGEKNDEDLEKQMLRQSMKNLKAAENSSNEASSTLQQAQQLNDETLAALDDLRDAIDQMPEQSQELKAEMVRIVNNIQFEFDDSEIIEPAHDELNSLANIMQNYPGLSINVAGHADKRGSDSYNKKLSQRRAQAVKDYLVNQGVQSSRITTDAYGESNSLMSGSSATAYGQNRSVRLTLSYNGSGMNDQMNDNDDSMN